MLFKLRQLHRLTIVANSKVFKSQITNRVTLFIGYIDGNEF